MARLEPFVPHPLSRLLQALQGLELIEPRLPHTHFVATLSKMLDFTGAMKLSDFLVDLPHTAVSAAAETDIPMHYLRARGDMIHFIVQSFTEGKTLTLPNTDDAMAEQDFGLEAYQRFYTLHQSEMEGRTLKLQTHVRRAIAAISPAMAQLCAIDSQLSQILLAYSRQALTVVPDLLAKRFRYLCMTPQHSDVTTYKHNVANFLSEMQTLLLAELDIRLQPTLGLINALDKEQEAKIQ